MAAPVEKNYLTTCKEFLKEFTATINPNDPLPIKVTGYNIEEGDLEGEILDWTLQYLNQRSCPQSLAVAIAHSVLNEIKIIVREDRVLRANTEGVKEVQYDPVRLVQKVIVNVNAVCERFLKKIESWDEKKGPCPNLPYPAPGPPFVSTFAIKNHRRRMEDRHVAIDDLHSLFNINSPGQVGYYAIFDGHNGHEAAAYSAAQLHGLIVRSEHYPKDPEAALKDAFLRADEIFIKKCASSQKLLSGTTVLVALLRHKQSLHVAWLGDSLGILVKSGGKVIQLVEPHTAERPDERNRVEAAGGVVIMHFHTWRINGTLSISRAIGDPDCKPHVSAAADVVTHQLDGTEHFLILACDGLWDCVTSEEASALVYEELRQDPHNYSEIGKSLVQLAKNRASNDNISVVVVLLSAIEDILATAPPPAAPSPVLEQPEALLLADGLAPFNTSPHRYLVNGTMDGETAQFDSIQKVPSPEGPVELATRNGHADIMMSSFYGNGAEDGRDLFGNPCDLGPETDVDLLDDDAGGHAEQVLTEESAWCGGGMAAGKVVCSDEALERVEENVEVVGVGVVEEEDDSEDEDAEWKYVPVKSVGGGIASVSPQPSLEDKPALDTAASGHEIDPPDLLQQTVDVTEPVAPGILDLEFPESLAPKEFIERQEADENKLCPELDLELVQKDQLEGNPNLSGDLLIQDLQTQVSEENKFLEGGLKQELSEEFEESLEDSAMESRLNPDAAEFVPISPTRSMVPESLPSNGHEFDVFKKEAEACPGEISDEISSIPAKNEEGHTVSDSMKMPFDRTDIDADVVLSSSFNCEQLNPEWMDKIASTEESVVKDSSNFIEEEDNKENMPVCDDKENILLPTSSDVIMMEDVIHTSQDREFERLEENISEEVSGTTATSDLHIVENYSVSEVLSEKTKFELDTVEGEFKKDEAAEPANLLTKVEVRNEESQSHGLTQSVEQTHEFLSSDLLSEQKEKIESSDDQVHSSEPVKAVQECITESLSSKLDIFEVSQSPEKDVHDFGGGAFEVNQSHEKVDDFDLGAFEIGQSQEKVVRDFEREAFEISQIQEKVVHDFEQEAFEVSQTPVKVVHDFEQEAFEVSQTPEKVVHDFEQEAFEISQTPEKVVHDFEVEGFEVSQSHEKVSSYDFEQEAFEVSQSHENIASHDLEQNVLSTQDQVPEDEKVQISEEIFKPDVCGVKEINDIDSLLMQADAQRNEFVKHVEHHALEHFNKQDAEIFHIEKQEICASTDEVSGQIQSSQPEHGHDDVLQTHLTEEKPQNYQNEGEQYLIEMGKEFNVKSTEVINTESPVDSSMEIIDTGIECTSFVPGSAFHTELETKIPTEQVLSPSPVPEVIPIPEKYPEILVTKSPTPGIVSSDIPISANFVAEQVAPPVQDDSPKSDEIELLVHETLQQAVTPDSENVTLLIDSTAGEPFVQVKETVEMKCEQVSAESSSLQQPSNEALPETTKEERVVEETVTTEPPMPAVISSSLPLDIKLPPKKASSVEKKKVPEKGKVTAMTAAKGKVAAKSPVPPARTSSVTAKASTTSPTKPTGTLTSRPTPAERKTAPAAGKPAASSKSTTAPLSSKPRTSTLKPSPVPTTRPTPPKSSAAATRPGTAGTSSSKPGLASTTSKPASAIAKSSVTQSKVTEIKRTVNGDASRPTSQNSSVPAKTAPRKLPLTSTTSASKPSASLTKTSARPSSMTQKAASEPSPKPKPQNVVNGTSSKPTRTVSATASKSAPLSALTKKPLAKTATSTLGDPKKAKESANKHISASRAPVGVSGVRRSTDTKGSVASKTAAAKGRPSETKAALSNGTLTKKAMDNSESIKKVEGKMDLVISENGVAVEGNEVRKEEESSVQGLCEVKEQVMLIVEEGVREAM